MNCKTPEQTCRYSADQLPPCPPAPITTRNKRCRSPSQRGLRLFNGARRCLAHVYPSPEKSSRMELVQALLPTMKRRSSGRRETEHLSDLSKPCRLQKTEKPRKPLRPQIDNRTLTLRFEDISLADREQPLTVSDGRVHLSTPVVVPVSWLMLDDDSCSKVRLSYHDLSFT